jgi:hypothetical protein
MKTLISIFIENGFVYPVYNHESNRNQFLPLLPEGTLYGGEEIKPGTLHGGEEIKPGTLHGGEEIKPGTLHNTGYSPATYRTKDGNAVYKFRFVDLGREKYAIDIISQPSYESRSSGNAVSHRLPSKRGGNKICLSTGFEPTTLDSAKKICMEWAELTHTYIKTGKSIDKQVKENSNPLSKLWGAILN